MEYSVLFLLQQLIREYGSIDEISGINLQHIGYIKETLQRETVGKAGCFDCADQRPAHSGLLRQRSYSVGYYCDLSNTQYSKNRDLFCVVNAFFLGFIVTRFALT